MLAVYLLVHQSVPAFGEMSRQLVAHVGYVHRERTGHDKQARVTAHPQLVDDRRHKAQNAARALETFQCGPVFVQAVEHFGMDGIAREQTLLVLDFLGFQREIRGAFAVHFAELGADQFLGRLVLAVEEETAAHDLKAFVGGHRLPDGFHAAEGMFDGFQGSFARFTADFDIRFRDGGHHQTVAAGAGGFGYLLNKGNEVVKTAGRQAGHAVDALGVGHEFIHKDKAGAAGIEKIFERFRAGRYTFLVGLFHVVVQFGVAS